MISDFAHFYAAMFIFTALLSMDISSSIIWKHWLGIAAFKVLPFLIALLFLFQLYSKYQIWLN